MAKDRYDTSDLVENQFEPGSKRRVLRNLLGIKRKREMDAAESQTELEARLLLAQTYAADHQFSAEDIRSIHRVWLGNIYGWAGDYRRVNLTKGGFPFATAAQIPRLMEQFESDVLSTNTPCVAGPVREVAQKIAVVHVELLLIHPFREGNGRLARMLAELMALQAGYPRLEFGDFSGANKEDYSGAVRSGLDREYEPMTRLFTTVLEMAASRRLS